MRDSYFFEGRTTVWLPAMAAMLFSGTSVVLADEPEEFLSSPTAVAFGSEPSAGMLKLSPDGTRISLLQPGPDRRTVLSVIDLNDGSSAVALSDDPDEFEFIWCEWANDSRILCGIEFRASYNRITYPATRLVGVNADGSEMRILSEPRRRVGLRQPEDWELSIIEDQVVDWLPNDPRHVLVEDPSRGGQSLSRLDIYSSQVTTEERLASGIIRWISGGQGKARLYLEVLGDDALWFVRKTPDADWSLLHESSMSNMNEKFAPIGFGEDPNELLFFDDLDGRVALFAMNLATGSEPRIVYANARYDVSGVYQYGRDKRPGAVGYVDDRPRVVFFDKTLQGVHDRVAALFPDQVASIIDEDWDGRYYLFFVSSPENAGRYYRFDSRENKLLQLFPAYSSLEQRKLVPMRPMSYEARDGAVIPAYLTLPERSDAGALPAVVLPHGGPSSRDVWNYDFLAQYLAAEGYVVLQSNYRGSAGYGDEWLGRGAFQDWRNAINDVIDGAQYLINEGIADADSVCAIGWSFGGYAALLGVIEAPKLFNCVVSIAGVTDPESLGAVMRRNFVGGLGAQRFIGTDELELLNSSPLKRADEYGLPVLLFHPAEDMNVPFSQATAFVRALDRANKSVEFIEYENAEHRIRPQHYRIDMLARIGLFLDEHIGVR